ncbi:MAG: RnfABCDGE type electron transport complex subunit G [Succinivibrio sp.]
MSKIEEVLDTKNKEPSRKEFSRPVRALLSALCLAITGCLCVLTVLVIDEATASLIEKNRSSAISEKVTSLMPDEAKEAGVKIECYVVKNNPHIGHNQKLFVASKAGAIKGYVMTYQTSMGYSDPLVLIAGFTKDKKVFKADIQFSQETPGLGDKVDRQHGNFLDALSNKSLSDSKFDVRKYGGDFDFITGSTVTSRAVVVSTGEALKALDEIEILKLKKCRLR